MAEQFFTNRLICRKIIDKDIELITVWNNSQEAYGEYLTHEAATYDENIIKLNNNNFWNDNSKTFLIDTKDNKTPIGTIKYWTKIGGAKTALVALKISIPEYRKQGYGTEVQKALIRELFKTYHFESVEMYTDVNNEPQQKCLLKLDFKNIKTENYTDAGTTRQGYLYKLTKERYEKSGVHIYYYE